MSYITGSSEIESLNPFKFCQLCDKKWGTPDIDGVIEFPVITPCSHIFGSRCMRYYMRPDPDDVSSTEYRKCPCCSHLLFFKGCGHAIRAQRVSFDEDRGTGSKTVSETSLQPRRLEWDMPDICRACAFRSLPLRATLLDKEKELVIYYHRLRWVSNAVDEGRLSPGWRDDVERSIGMLAAEIAILSPCAIHEIEQFMENRQEW